MCSAEEGRRRRYSAASPSGGTECLKCYFKNVAKGLAGPGAGPPMALCFSEMTLFTGCGIQAVQKVKSNPKTRAKLDGTPT
jgi:hypothetical protein